MKVTVIGIHGCLGQYLPQGGRTEACLGEFHGCTVEGPVFCHQCTHTRTAGTVALADGIDHHHMFFTAFQLQYRLVHLLVIGKFAVDFIGKKKKIVLQNEFAQGFQLFVRVDVARRVVGIANDDGFGALVDQCFEVRNRRQGKSVFDACRDRSHTNVAGRGKTVVIGIKGFRYDYLIARIETG